jgi:N4-(beta-N-acetylglucosaminyl)-L-asparaginase
MHGRRDSPIIGAGLYVDNEIGAATAIMGRSNTDYRLSLVVELMRQKSTKKACEEAHACIVNLTQKRNKNLKDIQVGFIALNKNGEYGSYCIQVVLIMQYMMQQEIA